MTYEGNLAQKHSVLLIIFVLIIGILVVYWPVKSYDEFVSYDDTLYTTNNYQIQQGFSFKSIAYCFTDIHTGHWNPLTMISHMLDWQLFGDRAGGHHWTSVIIHIFSTILLFLFLKTATGAIWRSAFVAALFALHPINVESVAWIAERKNVLSTFFWILTMLLYVWYVKSPGWKRYLPVIFCFVLGLMSKAMLVTLPFVLLLLDYWPLNRTMINQQSADQTTTASIIVKKEKISFLILEKAPLFVLSAVFMSLALYAANKTAANLDVLSIWQRLSNAVSSYGLYIKKMFWPVDLAVFYPFNYQLNIWHLVFAAIILVIITVFVFMYFRKFPYLPVGWFWYLGTLVPVIGIVQVGSQAMADRYAYVPAIGIFIMLVWGITNIGKKILSPKIVASIAIFVLLVLTVISYRQIQYWKESFTLFNHALNVTENNFLAHFMIANEFVKQKKLDDAMAHYKASLLFNNVEKISPLFGMGIVLSMQGKHEEAIDTFRQVIKMKPNGIEAYDNLAQVLLRMGKGNEAIQEYRKAIKLKIDNPKVYTNFGNALTRQGYYDEAIKQYSEALRIWPNDILANYNLGMVLMWKGKMDDALKYFQKTVILQPQYAAAHYQMAIILKKKGLINESNHHQQEAIHILQTLKNKK